MLIEHHLLTQSLEGKCYQDKQIGRITDLNYVKSLSKEYDNAQPGRRDEGGEILGDVGEKTTARLVNAISIDGYSVDLFSFVIVRSYAFRRDDRNLISCLRQGQAFAPHAAIERH